MKLNELKWIIYLKNTAYWILSTTANFSPYFESGKWSGLLSSIFLWSYPECYLWRTIIPTKWKLSMYLIYDGTISFQYLKILVAMKGTNLSENKGQFIFLRWIAPRYEVFLCSPRCVFSVFIEKELLQSNPFSLGAK